MNRYQDTRDPAVTAVAVLSFALNVFALLAAVSLFIWALDTPGTQLAASFCAGSTFAGAVRALAKFV